MSYTVPSTLVYQQLSTAGGAANISPDLDAVIIGPCYNIVDYDSSSTASLILSHATDISGNPVTITNDLVSTPTYLASQQPGQNLDSTSLAVYFNNAVTQTAISGFTATPSGTDLPIAVATSVTGAVTSGSAVIPGVTNANKFVVGDNVTLAGAGVAGAALVANVKVISGTNITLDQSASTSVSGSSTLTKNALNNLNTVSATSRIEVGDTALITYVTSGSVTKTFTTTISAVVATGNIVSDLTVSDMLPSDVVAGLVSVSVRKTYNNQLVASANYDATTTATTGLVTILPLPTIVYGTIISADVHIAYRAMRTDLSGVVNTITVPGDITGLFGVVDDRNPLALGVELALANTVTQILAVAVPSNDLLGYETALALLENAKVYTLVPLTQSTDILTAVAAHAQQMSTPQMAHWRVAALSTAIPTTTAIGPYNANLVNANSGNNAITSVSGKFVLTVSNATFMADGVVPGDVVVITAGTGTGVVGSHQILQVVSNQQVVISATGVATAISYYVSRNLTKAQQAAFVASMSTGYGSNRVFNCPNTAGVIVGGVTKYLPGYYFMCGIAGLIAGLPSQSGLTNIALAGFVDVSFSNFYFTRAQMDVMAAAGTLLIIQDTQGSIPYIRHELTTDMTVLQYREIQQVKNWDYLSYFFHDIMSGFIGKWNITPDSLNTLRQTLDSGAILLKGRKLPRVGAPLTDYTIASIAQDAVNLDNVNVSMNIKMPTVLNYLNLYLIV